MRCERGVALHFSLSDTFTDDYALDLFFRYISATEKTLGFCSELVPIGSRSVIRGKRIGKGATCTAYQCVTNNWSDTHFVLKVYEHASRAKREVDNLNHLHRKLDESLRHNVPQLIGNSNRNVLVNPQGRFFRRTKKREFTSKHLSQALTLLRGVHTCGLIHRDVRPANFFLAPNGDFLLNDWGCAVDMSVIDTVAYEGCPSPFRLLRAGCPRSAHDLYSFVISVYLLYHTDKAEEMPSVPFPTSGCWAAALQEAERGNYEGVFAQLDAVVTPDPDAVPNEE